MTDAAQRAADAWNEYQEHRIPSEEAQEVRNEAYLTIERANWEDAALIPLWVPTDQLYWYDRVENFRINGPLRRSKFNELTLSE